MAVPMDPTSAGFMLAESRSQPMHVGGLQLFELPEGAGPEYVRETYEAWLRVQDIAPLWLKRPRRSVATAGQWFWTQESDFDPEYHIRHNALPQPGRVRELLELVSRLHGTRLAHDRPLWEFHMIEGLNDGRLATYTKIHHALVDGMSAMRLLQSVLSTDPDRRDLPPPWAARPLSAKRANAHEDTDRLVAELPASALRAAVAVAGEAAGMPGALVRTLTRGFRNEPASVSFSAPRSVLNTNITGARRYAAQDWPLDRIKAVGRATGTTLNDVVLAMCSGALRTYLAELSALPDKSLVAMVPVSLHRRDDEVASQSGGNAVGTLMVRLGTDMGDPARRLEAIHSSMVNGKKALGTLSYPQVIAMSALGLAPAILTPALRMQGIAPPPFNLVISNVPGPRRPLYLNGARMSGMYPLSIPLHGQALNITCVSYVDQLAFGLTGCRRTLPHMQRLLVHLEDELAGLEKAAGL